MQFLYISILKSWVVWWLLQDGCEIYVHTNEYKTRNQTVQGAILVCHRKGVLKTTWYEHFLYNVPWRPESQTETRHIACIRFDLGETVRKNERKSMCRRYITKSIYYKIISGSTHSINGEINCTFNDWQIWGAHHGNIWRPMWLPKYQHARRQVCIVKIGWLVCGCNVWSHNPEFIKDVQQEGKKMYYI